MINANVSSNPTAYPELIVTPWQTAFNGGWRIPVTCFTPAMKAVTYWWARLRDWEYKDTEEINANCN